MDSKRKRMIRLTVHIVILLSGIGIGLGMASAYPKCRIWWLQRQLLAAKDYASAIEVADELAESKAGRIVFDEIQMFHGRRTPNHVRLAMLHASINYQINDSTLGLPMAILDWGSWNARFARRNPPEEDPLLDEYAQAIGYMMDHTYLSVWTICFSTLRANEDEQEYVAHLLNLCTRYEDVLPDREGLVEAVYSDDPTLIEELTERFPSRYGWLVEDGIAVRTRDGETVEEIVIPP